MNDFAEHMDKSMRLATLRILKEMPQYSVNTSVLDTALNQLGFKYSRAKVEAECDWLRDASLVTINDLGAVKVVTLTQRGLDVAEGATTVTGVERPKPRG